MYFYSDGSSLDMATIFPQVTYGNKRSSDGKGTLSTVLLIQWLKKLFTYIATHGLCCASTTVAINILCK